MNYKQKLLANYKVIRRVTDTTPGKELLKLLDELFNPATAIGADTHETYFNLGQQSLVTYLKTIAEADLTTLEQELEPVVARSLANLRRKNNE